ncbi:MAG: hypothetical protein ACEQSB_06325, partial [Undibacterium sp.]
LFTLLETVMEMSLKQMMALPPEGTHDVNLPRSIVGVLRQMRSRMSLVGLNDLADSISAVGQHTPGLAVALNARAARKYLKSINEMWGTRYRLSQFTPVYIKEKRDEFYIFLVAGHRRFKAVEMTGRTTFYARLHFESTFSEALLLQYHENVHEQVPPDEEARFITLFWREAKKKDPDLPLAKFARGLGKKPEAVRRSIRFTALPVRIQELVLPNSQFKKGIAYALLCELARLQEARIEAEKPFDESELMQLAYVLITQYKTAKRAAAWVSEQIRVLQGQGEMFALSIQDALNGAKQTAAGQLETTIRVGEQQLRIVARLHTEGGVERVASGAAAAAVGRTLDVASELAPQIITGLHRARGASVVRQKVAKVTGQKSA